MFFCNLATSLPSGIDMLIGNDLCPSLSAVNVAVVTRSQTAALRRDSELQNLAQTDPLVSLADEETEPVVKSAESDLASTQAARERSKAKVWYDRLPDSAHFNLVTRSWC